MEALKQVTILLVDDDTADQKLIKGSLLNQRIANYIFVAESGEEALDYLARSKINDSECPVPNLILLDLNMPGMGGKEFLRRVKEDDTLDAIPIVVLTTSDLDEDILESYKLQAAGYIRKPVSLQGLHEVLRKLGEYWFVICKQVSDVSILTCSR
ncbi:MAG: response regulator [Candidatus Micrarchaeota archaeon]